MMLFKMNLVLDNETSEALAKKLRELADTVESRQLVENTEDERNMGLTDDEDGSLIIGTVTIWRTTAAKCDGERK